MLRMTKNKNALFVLGIVQMFIHSLSCMYRYYSWKKIFFAFVPISPIFTTVRINHYFHVVFFLREMNDKKVPKAPIQILYQQLGNNIDTLIMPLVLPFLRFHHADVRRMLRKFCELNENQNIFTFTGNRNVVGHEKPWISDPMLLYCTSYIVKYRLEHLLGKIL